MPQFRVGDRVKFIDRGWSNFLVFNEEYTVVEVNHRGSVYVPNGARRMGPYHAERFELVAPPVPVQRPGTVFYSVVFRRADGTQGVLGADTLEKFEANKHLIRLRRGWTIVCEKKLTLTLPNQEA